MQNANFVQFGVSPAFFVSRAGECFGPADIERSLPVIEELGFSSFQSEIYDRSVLSRWRPRDARTIARRAADAGLRCDVFVAHFLGHEYSTMDALANSSGGAADLERVLDLASELDEAPTVVVPSLPYAADGTSFATVQERAVAKFAEYARRATTKGARLAVEPVPGGIVNGGCAFERLRSAGLDLWYVLDTGNIWASGESPAHAAERLSERLAATHLCEASGMRETSRAPGTGGVQWQWLFGSLRRCGYSGSLDIEIRCTPEQVAGTYSAALAFVKRMVDSINEMEGTDMEGTPA